MNNGMYMESSPGNANTIPACLQVSEDLKGLMFCFNVVKSCKNFICRMFCILG